MIKKINYEEFKELLTKDTIFYIGGSWCKNCIVVEDIINEVFTDNNTIIYNLDPRVGGIDSIHDFRKCNNKEQLNQYKEFISLLGYTNNEYVEIDETITNIPLLRIPSIISFKDGILNKHIIKEYLEEDLDTKTINNYKEELQELINTHH